MPHSGSVAAAADPGCGIGDVPGQSEGSMRMFSRCCRFGFYSTPSGTVVTVCGTGIGFLQWTVRSCNLPRQLIHSGYRTPAEQVYHPQGLVSTLYGLQTRIPIDFDLAAHGDERKMALAHLSCLGAGDVDEVYDRGYYSYAMLYEHVARGLEVVFRMRRNVGVVFDQFMTSVDTDQRVEVCPSHKSKVKVREKHPDAECGPIRVRLVKYTVATTTYTLATTLLDVRQ